MNVPYVELSDEFCLNQRRNTRELVLAIADYRGTLGDGVVIPGGDPRRIWALVNSIAAVLDGPARGEGSLLGSRQRTSPKRR